MSKKIDYTGKKQGKLSILNKSLVKGKDGCFMWDCLCDCGNKKTLSADSVRQGTKSCGCFQKEIAKMGLHNYISKTISDGKQFSSFKGVGNIPKKYFWRLNRNRKIKKLDFTITMDYIWDLFLKQNGKCAISGMEIYLNDYNLIQQTASLDRIDSSKGYIGGNVQWVHRDINRIKSDFSQDYLQRMCELIYNHNLNKGLLYKTRVYLGGNLEVVDDDIEWRKKITDKVSSIGIICLDPTKETFVGYKTETRQDREILKIKRGNGDYDFVTDYMQNVISRDLRCIDICDFVIFKLELDKPTYGSMHELVVAEQQHKPIFLVIENKNKIPLWLAGLVKFENIFTNIDDLVICLKNINENKKEINKKEWKLLNHCYR